MYLVDTNIWLERLLEQEKADEVRQFIAQIPSVNLHLTDFTLHSIGLALCRVNKGDDFLQFVSNAFVESSVTLLRLSPPDMTNVVVRMRTHNLDFDDAYQYVSSEKYNLQIVSLDSDFDRTPRGRKTPSEILASSK